MILQSTTPPLQRNHGRLYLGLFLIAVIAMGSWFAASYYLQLISGNPSGVISNDRVTAHMFVNYGNGTSGWTNSTVQSGTNFYNATITLVGGRVETQYFVGLGYQIISINGFRPAQGDYWFLYLYCTSDQAWMSSKWGASSISFSNATSVRTSASPYLTLRSNAFAWSVQNPPVQGAPILPSDKTCS